MEGVTASEVVAAVVAVASFAFVCFFFFFFFLLLITAFDSSTVEGTSSLVVLGPAPKISSISAFALTDVVVLALLLDDLVIGVEAVLEVDMDVAAAFGISEEQVVDGVDC